MKKEKPMLSVADLIQAQGKWDRSYAGKWVIQSKFNNVLTVHFISNKKNE